MGRFMLSTVSRLPEISNEDQPTCSNGPISDRLADDVSCWVRALRHVSPAAVSGGRFPTFDCSGRMVRGGLFHYVYFECASAGAVFRSGRQEASAGLLASRLSRG